MASACHGLINLKALTAVVPSKTSHVVAVSVIAAYSCKFRLYGLHTFKIISGETATVVFS